MNKIPIKEFASRPAAAATWAWTLAFLVNLPVPIYCACWAVTGWGYAGLTLGLLVIYVAGWRLALARPSLIQTVATGGYVVAATQVFPIPQMMVGIFSVMLAGTIVNQLWRGGMPEDDLDLLFQNGPFEAFLATIATGVGLLLPAFGIGLMLDRLFSPPTKPKPPPPEL